MSDSSTEDVGGTADETQVVNQAESTPAVAEGGSLVDAIDRALNPPDPDGVDAGAPTAEKPSPQAGAETKEPSTDDKKPAADPSEEEIKQYTPGAQARIRELVSAKNDLRAEVDSVRNESVQFKDKAERFDKLTGYLTQHGITSDEANNSLEITRLIKGGRYEDALRVMQPVYAELVRRTGGVLDTDLQEEVRLGHISRERALEVQRGRVDRTNSEEMQRQANERSQREQAEQRWKGHVAEVAKAADEWAKAKATGDPDWAAKSSLLEEQVKLDILTNGFPKSKEEAIQRTEAALVKVEDRLRTFRPAPTPITPTTTAGKTSTRKDPPPKSMLEAIERAL